MAGVREAATILPYPVWKTAHVKYRHFYSMNDDERSSHSYT